MSHRIPNSLSLAVALLFLPAAYLGGLDAVDAAIHCLVAIAVMLVIIFGLKAPYGVTKLVGALSLWFGASISLFFFIFLAFTAMAVAFLVLKIVGRPTNSLPVLPYAFGAFAVVFAYMPLGAALISKFTA